MFERIKEIGNSAKRLNRNRLFNAVLDLDFIKDMILDLNTEDQLFNEGININGEVVGYYAKTYKALKDGHIKGFNQHYDFMDSGQFLDSFKIRVANGYLIITASNEKMDSTPQVNYGKDLIGLTDANMEVLAKEVQPYLVNEIIRQLLK